MTYGHRPSGMIIQSVRPAYCVVSKLGQFGTSVFFIAIDRTSRSIDTRTSFAGTTFPQYFLRICIKTRSAPVTQNWGRSLSQRCCHGAVNPGQPRQKRIELSDDRPVIVSSPYERG